MFPSQRSKRPDAPARLAKIKSLAQDRFKTRIYHLSNPDLFITINYKARPEVYSWVVVACPEDGEPVIALYDGQEYIGVVEIMDYMELDQSEQWRPRICSRFFNW